MSCSYCHKDVKHCQPCKVFLQQQKLKEENEKLLIATTTDITILRNEILRLNNENAQLRDEIKSMKYEQDRVPAYTCYKCGRESSYGGTCSRCTDNELESEYPN